MITETPEMMLAEGREEVEAGSDRPFLLDGEGVWLVRRGRIDVFSVRVGDDGATGAREHLLRVGAGALLFSPGAAAGGRKLLAVGGAGTRIVPLDWEEIAAAAAGGGELRAALASAVETWVDLLCGAVAAVPPPQGCLDLDEGVTTPPSAAPAVRCGQGVCWITHEAGRSSLIGRNDLTVNGDGSLPLSRRVWLRPHPGARLRVEDTAAALAGDGVRAGLARLHLLVLRWVERHSAEAETAEEDRLSRKAAAGRRALVDACATLAASVTPGRGAGARLRERALSEAERDDCDTLYAACRLVATAQGITIRQPSAEAREGVDPLAAIARASRFRTRTVVLRDEWWREEGGPFLARHADDRRPLALLPAPHGGYTMDDPRTGTRTRVGAEEAEEIDPCATSFYRPFGSQALRVADILRFGLASCGRDVATLVAMSLATATLSLVTPLATGMVFNDVIPRADRSQLLEITAILLGIAVATALLGLVCNLALVRMDGKMGASIQAAVWDRLLSLPMSFFRPFTAGDLATRAMGVDGIRQVLSSAAITGLMGAVVALFNLVLLFHFNARLASWGVLLIAIAVSATVITAWLQVRYQREITLLQGRIAGTVLQFLTGLPKLRVAGAEVFAFATWTQRFAAQRELQYRVRTRANALAAFNAGFPVVASLVVFLVAAPMLTAADAELRTGDFLGFTVAFMTCMGGLLAVSGAAMTTLVTIPMYELAKPILVSAPEVSGATRPPGTLSGQIELQRIRFGYSESAPPVLRDLSLSIRAGEFLALVGASGSGKSTILRLLLGFESPESGAIYYDGQDLGGLDVQAVRRQIGVVLQNGRLMPGDLFTNIVGSSQATLQDAWEAARMAGLDEDIRGMPMGMHTVISEGGGTLSGGQRQRLMIARAIVQRPRMLIFDEATSALDNRTQAIVSDSMARLQATRIVVAHRLSTIQHADRICVLERGQVVQEGTFTELMQQHDGPFAELARRQIA